MTMSLQDKYAANSICFGCGPANKKGFQIKSFAQGNKVVADYTPKPHHNAFPGVLNGGVIGTLLDCHCNWAAAWFLMQDKALDTAPSMVTAEYHIKLLRPTPMDKVLHLETELESIDGNKVTVFGKIMIGEKVYDTCRGTFISVPETHPAFHRW